MYGQPKIMDALKEAYDLIDRYKAASGLMDSSGDPDGSTPERLDKYISNLHAELEQLNVLLGYELRENESVILAAIDEIKHLRQCQDKIWGAADEALCAGFEKRIEYFKQGFRLIVEKFCSGGDFERCSHCVDTAQFANEMLNERVRFVEKNDNVK